MEPKILYPLIYLGMISVISVIVCIYDKIAAKHNPRHRTRERTLLLLSALGGSVAMFVTMQLIRHKTKHVKFMVGIPVIFLLQVALVAFLYIKVL
ncbi:MAG: DUF1294 domain-containing protein [Clostridia bacterium]|nr:DUF1294 domain-containing protein [Clostridia bacterium]